jgi:hypothetical protein
VLYDFSIFVKNIDTNCVMHNWLLCQIIIESFTIIFKIKKKSKKIKYISQKGAFLILSKFGQKQIFITTSVHFEIINVNNWVFELNFVYPSIIIVKRGSDTKLQHNSANKDLLKIRVSCIEDVTFGFVHFHITI